MNPKPRILFLSLTDNDGAYAPIAEMGRLGCDCALMSPPGFTCSLSRFASRHFHLPRHRGMWLGILRVRSRLERAVREWHPDLIVPLDDVAAWVLRGHATGRSLSAELRRILETSLGSPSGYATTSSRSRFLEFATRIGVRVPQSRAVERPAVLAAASATGYPVALKREDSWGGRGVQIAHDPEQLKAAIVAVGNGRWGSLTRVRAAARRLIWRLASIRSTKTTFELQQFIPGAGAMRIVAAWQGRVLAGVTFEKLCEHPKASGPSTVTRVIEHPEIEEMARQVVAALSYAGFAHFDFILDKASGRAFVIEMNTRATASVHLGRLFGHDVCGAMARQLGGLTETMEATVPRERTPIVRFPRELERDPESIWLRAGSEIFHDVPWDEPAVLDFYYNRLLAMHPGHAGLIAHLLGKEDRAVKIPV